MTFTRCHETDPHMIPSPLYGNCPVCGCRDLDPATDLDGVCAYCAHYTIPDAARIVADARRNHRAIDPNDLATLNASAMISDLDSIDLMHPLIYGGDIDTLHNLIDFESID